ncbi:hypothetical protein HW555_005845 [Spodoptera exigua]|uniref:PPPDE domain-containing protein n=1 Tax=Spodoptera exigua TaxID=7107 RepID=A0A835GFQ6_SPOEX|nr:hypothetical protein HW555_005845 [Spodoptera exigua]
MHADSHHPPFSVLAHLEAPFQPMKRHSPIKYNYFKANYQEINTAIMKLNWDELLLNLSCEESVDTFYDRIYGIRRQFKQLCEQCYKKYMQTVEESIPVNVKHFWKYISNRGKGPGIPANMQYKNNSTNCPAQIYVAARRCHQCLRLKPQLGGTQLGPPHRVERLGETFVPFQVFSDYIQGLSTTTYSPSAYNLLEHNCNHFSEEVAQFLCGAHVPKHITVYANGGSRATRADSPDYLTLNSQIEEVRAASQELDARRSTLAEKLARKERRRDKKRKKQGRDRGDEDAAEMAEAVETAAASVPEELSRAGPSSDALAAEADERREEELRKRNRDPPIVFSDIDGVQEFEKFSKALEGVELTPEERQSVDELQQYLVQGEGSWDRRHHALLNYAHAIDAHPIPEQLALALFLCNLFENVSASEWLLYISEWDHNGQPLSNIRATTKVAVHSCLSSEPELRDVGTALMYNIATKERFQVGKALRDMLPSGARSKELLWRATRALARFAAHSHDVPQLVAMVGPDPAAFRGTSPRVDEQIDLIMKRIK